MSRNKHQIAPKKRTSPQKSLIVIACVCVLAVLAAGLWVALGGKKAVKITLQGEEIPQEVFDQVMAQQISDVVYAYSQLGLDSNDPEFWSTAQDGATPGETLMKHTLQQLRTLTAVYELAQETGTPVEGGLNGLLERLEGENQSRAEKKAAGEPVYGLSQFTLQTFLEYELDYLKKQYCADPDNPGMEITQEDREVYYQENRETAFRLPDGISLSYVYMNQYRMDAREAQGLTQQLQQLAQALDSGQQMEQAVEQYPDLLEYYSHLELEPDQVSSYADTVGDVLDLAYALEPGQNSGVVENNGGVYLVACDARSDAAYLSLEDVTGSIDDTLRQQRYDALVERRAAELNLEANEQEVLAYIVDQMT